MTSRARCVRQLAAPVRAWGRLGFAMGLFGAPVRPARAGNGPRPSAALFREATASMGHGIGTDAAALKARISAFEEAHLELMAEETAALRTHYALRTFGLSLDFAMQVGLLCLVVYAAFAGAPPSTLWVAFGTLAAWMGPMKLVGARRLLRREDALARLPSPLPLPWEAVVDGSRTAEHPAEHGR